MAEEQELNRRKQTWAEQESVLRKEYNYLQSQISLFEVERRKVEEQKQNMMELGIQLQEESAAISQFKETVDVTRRALENMRADVDNKEAFVKDEEAKLDAVKKELMVRQQQLENLRYQYLRNQNVAEASRKLIMSFSKHDNRKVLHDTYEHPEESLYRNIPIVVNEDYAVDRPRMGSGFRADDFIREIQTEVRVVCA
eukprot:TRINITY_DN13781_c0_g2_i2.p1 TRINITY_DN13781_c0_g2~~TRINITY_DN13781_c0_g2_i2.p1  ORF type:complete len:198 (-),score=53.87 TRINITY_DN13781_c0_g2_i2:351-944(-)